MLKLTLAAVALAAVVLSAHASDYDLGLGQSAKDRHAASNYFSGYYDFGPAKSSNDRHAPGNYAPSK